MAKQVFQVHGGDAQGKVVVRKRLRRKEVVAYFTNLPACEIGREAWSSSHYWARRLQELGHTVKLMAPQFVRPYVKTHKNDARDAEAIGEAVSRPSMRFVPIKAADQQAILALHRARQGCVKARTAQANQLRSLLAEFGSVVPQGIHVLLRQVPAIVSEDENGWLESVRSLFTRLLGQVKEWDRHVWNIHTHPDVLSAVEKSPRITPVWLPTYSPWLNPIEKLWRWLRQDVLKMHRWVEDWPQVKQRVHDFLDQFAQSSPDLLRYVGLVGKGKLATVLNTS